MTFEKALQLLKQGKKVRRKEWISLDTYAVFSNDDMSLRLVDTTKEYTLTELDLEE